MLEKLIEKRKKLFYPHIINIQNKEWLYMLKEDTRNSVMIEGIISNENELYAMVANKYKSESEISNYFKTAKFYYNLAIDLHKNNEPVVCITYLKNAQKILFENIINNTTKLGNFRSVPIKISRAKIKPPEYDIYDWIKLWCEYIKYAFSNHPVHEAAARIHTFFEAIHPFEDGNGRIGRIFLNFLLLVHGYINIVIKGMASDDRKKYILSLEKAEKGLRKIFEDVPSKYTPENIDSFFDLKDTKDLREIIGYALIDSYNSMICAMNKNDLITVNEYAKQFNLKPDTVRKMISRRNLIACKPKGRWLIYPVKTSNI